MATVILAVAGGLALLLILYLIFAFNGLVRGRTLVREGFSGIDVQLKRRHDLIPNLIATVKGYTEFEKDVLEDVTRLRTAAMSDESLGDRQRDENALTSAMRTLFAVAENYPDLKANASFLDLQDELANIENDVQKSRRYYNGTVRDQNIRVESFPSNLVAGMFGFRVEEFFELDSAAERDVPQVEV